MADDEHDDEHEHDDDAPDLETIRSDPEAALRTQNALKTEAGDYRRKLRRAEDELAQLRSASQSESERAVSEAEQRGAESERAKWARKLLEADLRAAAVGVLRDPVDAVRLIDVDELLALDDDTRDLAARVKQLAEDKPYLAQPANGDGATTTPRRGARAQGVRSPAAAKERDTAGGDDWLRRAARQRHG